MNREQREICVVDLGMMEYKECWDLQKNLFELRKNDLVPDILLLTEHPHVYTIGKTGNLNHLLASEDEMLSRGIQCVHIDRGGDITYHGPGQIVGYPILDLKSYYLDLHRYLRDLEQVVIDTLASFSVRATRNEEYTGVWVNGEKICAIGVKSNRWITMHGFALNLTTDLSFFERIIPCGIFECSVTSLDRSLEVSPSPDIVRRELVRCFAKVFETRTRWDSVDNILDSNTSLTTVA